MKFAVISASSSGDNTVVAAVTGKKIRVLSYTAIATADVTVTWKSGASTSISGAMAFAANGGAAPTGAIMTPAGIIPLFETNAGDALVLNLSAANAVNGHLTYVLAD